MPIVKCLLKKICLCVMHRLNQYFLSSKCHKIELLFQPTCRNSELQKEKSGKVLTFSSSRSTINPQTRFVYSMNNALSELSYLCFHGYQDIPPCGEVFTTIFKRICAEGDATKLYQLCEKRRAVLLYLYYVAEPLIRKENRQGCRLG